MIATALLFADVAASSPAPALTLQQQFQQASAALDAGNSNEALAEFQAIAARPGISARTRGIIFLREGQALIALHRDTEATAALRAGLAMVPANDATLTNDRFTAFMALGGLERANYDYAAARQAFGEARMLGGDDDTARLQALLALAQVTMFDDVTVARTIVDEAVAIGKAGKVTHKVDGAIKDMRGRVLLNQGDAKGALTDLKAAVNDMGGLTERTDIQDVVVRSDAALAALKAKDDDEARIYLGMTGEGRLPDGPFAAPAETKVPPCGGDIRPDDVVVVEFGIGDDGKVGFANPIYASRQGPIAVEFARAVSNWAWTPSSVQSIPLFYRAVTRVELRCSTALERPGDVILLAPAYANWLADRKIEGPSQEMVSDLSRLRAELSRRKDGTPLESLPYLLALAQNRLTEFKERNAALEQATAIVLDNHAPIAVQTYFRIMLLEHLYAAQNEATQFQTALRNMLRESGTAADPQAGNVVRLMLAAPRYRATPLDGITLLQQIIADTRLDPHDPLRVGALLRLASLQAQRGDLANARQAYLSSGLTAQQCALVDARPAVSKMGVTSNDYPMDALRWRIGGWTQLEFDIQSDGRTVNRRAIMSYPPFVFGDPTIKAMDATRYTQTYRPDGGIGCSAASQRFRYMVGKG